MNDSTLIAYFMLRINISASYRPCKKHLKSKLLT